MKLSKNHTKNVLTLTEAELNAVRYSLHHTMLMKDIGAGADVSEAIRRAARRLKEQAGDWSAQSFDSDMNAVGQGK